MDTVIDAPVAADRPSGWASAIPPDVAEKIRERYVRGERLTILAAEYSIPYNTLSAKSSRDGWGDLRDEYDENSRKAATTPPRELLNRAVIEQALGPQTDYLAQVDAYREAGVSLQLEYDRIRDLLSDDGLENQDRVALTRTLIQLHERLQVALSIPSVKPVELRQSGTERRVAAVPVG